MSEEAPQEKIIGLPETILMTLLVGMEELVEVIILVFTLGAGIIVTESMNLAMFSLIEMYMLLRGGKGIMKLLVEPIGSFINGISANILPGKTVGLLSGIYIINHPEKIDKLMQVIGKVLGKAAQAAATAAVGIAGGGAAKAIGGKVAGAAGGAVEAGASAARQRMTMATGASSSKLEGVNRMFEARARAKQQMSKEVPQGIPEDDMPLKEAA